jgi:undecaprenyl-diphosphatase
MIETLQRFDTALFLMINGAHHPAADLFFKAITNLGSGWVVTPVLLVIAFVKVPRQRLARVIACGAIGLSLSGIVNSQIKHAVHRERPVGYFGKQEAAPEASASITAPQRHRIRLVGPAYRSRSFPSGHTNTAFASATLCALLFGGWWFTAYAVAVLVGYSRVYLGVHFPLDAAAGALLGAGVMALIMWGFGCLRKTVTSRSIHDKQ